MYIAIEEAAHDFHISEIQVWTLIINHCVGFHKDKNGVKVKYEDLEHWVRFNPDTYTSMQEQPTLRNALVEYFGIKVQYKFKQKAGFEYVVHAKYTKPNNQVRFFKQ